MYSTNIIISGTERSRYNFDPSLSHVLRAQQSSLIVDLSFLSVIHSFTNPLQQYVFIVSSARELLHVFSHVQDEDNDNLNNESSHEKIHDNNGEINIDSIDLLLKSESQSLPSSTTINTTTTTTTNKIKRDVLIAGCVSCRIERAAIRLVALRAPFNCGICISSSNTTANTGSDTIDSSNAAEGKARQIFDSVTTHWKNIETSMLDTVDNNKFESRVDAVDVRITHNLNDDSQSIVKKRNTTRIEDDVEDRSIVWGDAVWSSDEDLIIPPGWDSEAKIRAVVDANGDSFEHDIETRARTDLSSQINKSRRDDMEQLQQKKSPTKTSPIATSTDTAAASSQWFQNYQSWLERMSLPPQQKENSEPNNMNKETGSSTATFVHTDYFQRLLSSTMRRPPQR